MGVYGSPHKRMVESFEIWHTHWGQSPGPIHKVSCPMLWHSSATNGSKFELCLHTQLLNRMTHFQKWGTTGFPGSRRVQCTPWRQFPVYRFSAISGFIKNLWKPTSPTILVESSSKLPQMIFRPSLTKVIEGYLIHQTVCPVQPIKFCRKAAKQEVKPYLSSSLRQWHQIWYAYLEPYSGDVLQRLSCD